MRSALRHDHEARRKAKLGMQRRLKDIGRVINIWSLQMARHEKGAVSVEYAVMVGLIAAVIILAVQALGIETNNAFQSVLDVWP
jgi:Flp pilus assembly pilin Flp